MRQKILIVEDDQDCRDIIVIQMQGLGYRTIEAGSGATGLEKALSESPDLIIMDLGLPGISGVEATRWLKEDPRTKHIPIVVYTAWEEEERKKKLFQLGADRVLTKPASCGVLEHAVQHVLETSSKTAGAQS